MMELSPTIPPGTILDPIIPAYLFIVKCSWCQQEQVEDCGFRMLVPKEIQAAMAFPSDYILTGTRREQVKQLGNAVTPPAMQILVSRVLASLAA